MLIVNVVRAVEPASGYSLTNNWWLLGLYIPYYLISRGMQLIVTLGRKCFVLFNIDIACQ